MKIIELTTDEKTKARGLTAYDLLRMQDRLTADVIIVDRRIVKNRYGAEGILIIPLW